MTLDLAVIILNYRTAELTKDCLASMEAEIEPGISVVVVDNASGDGSADAIERTIEDRGWARWARVLRSPTNGGFAAGNNLGVRSVEAAAYLLLNSDTLVRPGRDQPCSHPGCRVATTNHAASSTVMVCEKSSQRRFMEEVR